MRFTFFTIAALSALVSGQASISDLPTCAQGCVNAGISNSGCSSLVDIACICKSTVFVNNLSCCVYNSCNAADQATTVAFATKLCSSVGVTGLPTQAGCSNSTSSATNSGSTSASASFSSTASKSSSATAATASTAGATLAQKLGLAPIAAGVAALLW